MRELKYHEKKLLKKVDFLNWKQDHDHRETKVMRRYHLQDREDYHKYNKLCGQLRSFAHRLSLLPAQDPFRSKMEGQMLSKLYDMYATILLFSRPVSTSRSCLKCISIHSSFRSLADRQSAPLSSKKRTGRSCVRPLCRKPT
ncbi:Small subunit (SSU) processome component [Serendipita sp. 400]|nr:Small subunit (SSU) processome component [Serendipita sp. 400]